MSLNVAWLLPPRAVTIRTSRRIRKNTIAIFFIIFFYPVGRGITSRDQIGSSSRSWRLELCGRAFFFGWSSSATSIDIHRLSRCSSLIVVKMLLSSISTINAAGTPIRSHSPKRVLTDCLRIASSLLSFGKRTFLSSYNRGFPDATLTKDRLALSTTKGFLLLSASPGPY